MYWQSITRTSNKSNEKELNMKSSHWIVFTVIHTVLLCFFHSNPLIFLCYLIHSRLWKSVMYLGNLNEMFLSFLSLFSLFRCSVFFLNYLQWKYFGIAQLKYYINIRIWYKFILVCKVEYQKLRLPFPHFGWFYYCHGFVWSMEDEKR